MRLRRVLKGSCHCGLQLITFRFFHMPSKRQLPWSAYKAHPQRWSSKRESSHCSLLSNVCHCSKMFLETDFGDFFSSEISEVLSQAVQVATSYKIFNKSFWTAVMCNCYILSKVFYQLIIVYISSLFYFFNINVFRRFRNQHDIQSSVLRNLAFHPCLIILFLTVP